MCRQISFISWSFRVQLDQEGQISAKFPPKNKKKMLIYTCSTFHCWHAVLGITLIIMNIIHYIFISFFYEKLYHKLHISKQNCMWGFCICTTFIWPYRVKNLKIWKFRPIRFAKPRHPLLKCLLPRQERGRICVCLVSILPLSLRFSYWTLELYILTEWYVFHFISHWNKNHNNLHRHSESSQ